MDVSCFTSSSFLLSINSDKSQIMPIAKSIPMKGGSPVMDLKTGTNNNAAIPAIKNMVAKRDFRLLVSCSDEMV